MDLDQIAIGLGNRKELAIGSPTRKCEVGWPVSEALRKTRACQGIAAEG